MNSDLAGRWFRSLPQAWIAGGVFPVKTDFLAPARHFQVPEVCQLVFRFAGTVTPVGGTALGADFAKLWKNVTFRDEAEMINASGTMLRLLEQMEQGSKQVDPADMTLGGGAKAIKARTKFYFEPSDTRAIRPRDFRVPLVNFLDGGNLLLTMNDTLPTNWGVPAGDWTVTVHAFVRDGRVPELKSRRRILEQVVSQQEFDYQVQGSIRAAILASNLATTEYTDLSGFTTIYSRTLDMPPQMETDVLLEEYTQSADALGANDEFVAQRAIPLKIPGRGQKIGQMISTPTLHIDLRQAAPASGRLLTDVVVNRTANLSALAAGYPNPIALQNAVTKFGVCVGAAGNFAVATTPPDLARKLPVRIRTK